MICGYLSPRTFSIFNTKRWILPVSFLNNEHRADENPTESITLVPIHTSLGRIFPVKKMRSPYAVTKNSQKAYYLP